MRRTTMTMVSLGAALALTACGGDGESEDTGSGSSSSSASSSADASESSGSESPGSDSSGSESSGSGSSSSASPTGSGSSSSAAGGSGGEPEDEAGDTPEDVVEEYATALGEKDYATICETIDPATVDAMLQASGADSCEDELEASGQQLESITPEQVDKLEIGEAEVAADGQTATLTTTFEDNTTEVRLSKSEGLWKITQM